MRAFALAEIGDSEAIDVFLRREDAWAALAEILEDEPDWAGSLFVVPIRIGVSLEHLEAEISANGLSHPLDIAMKHPDEADCFAYNDENSNAYQGRLESHRLTGESFRAEVTVRAGNPGHQEAVTRSFKIMNPGAGSDLEIVPV